MELPQGKKVLIFVFNLTNTTQTGIEVSLKFSNLPSPPYYLFCSIKIQHIDIGQTKIKYLNFTLCFFKEYIIYNKNYPSRSPKLQNRFHSGGLFELEND